MNEKEKEEFSKIIEELKEVRLSKSADYGNSWKVFGLKGIVYQIGSKFVRIWNLQGKKPSNEALEDSFRDIAVYGMMGMQLIRSGQMKDVFSTLEEVMQKENESK